MLPIALLVMMAMVLPSVGGWGPREGVTAWAFGAAGLGAQRRGRHRGRLRRHGLVASLPGAVVLVVAWFRRHAPCGADRTAAPGGSCACLTARTPC